MRPLLDKDEKNILDFTGVNVVTNSFADECIAKLLLEMPLDELKKRTTFRGLNPLAERCVLVALQRRDKVIKEAKILQERKIQKNTYNRLKKDIY